MPDERPDILLVMTDQQRYDSLGCTGFAPACTPNLDRLAAEGACFDRCIVNNPVCTPSRASLLTGKHLPGHGVYRLYDNLPREEILVTERLRRRGYRTALFGKLHVSGTHEEAERRHPHDGFDIYEWCLEGPLRMDSPFHGYRKWLEETDPAFCERLRREGRDVLHIPQHLHMTHWAAERTIDFISHAAADRPFFCFMSIFDPHNPYEDYPLDTAERLDPDAIPDPLPPGEGPVPEALRREREESYLGRFSDMSQERIRAMRFGYHASIAFADAEIGRVLAALEASGRARNTLVVFTSDHGDMLGDHGLLVKGAFFYDPNVRVPLLMRWPERFAAGRRVNGLVQLHDLAATILDAAGASDEAADVMPESASLLPLAAGEADAVRDHAVCCYRNSGIRRGGEYWDPPIHGTMFRSDRHKLSLFHGSDGDAPEGQLFDMDADPLERNDLRDDPSAATVKAELLARLADWLGARERMLGSRGGGEPPDPSRRMPNAIV